MSGVNNASNDIVEKVLFIFNAISILVLAILFGLEAFDVAANSVTAPIGHLFMGSLAAYVTMKRTGRWGENHKENLRRGEWFAIAFVAYALLVLAPLYVMFDKVHWPPLLTPVTFEILGLLAGNEIVKTISKTCKNNNKKTK